MKNTENKRNKNNAVNVSDEEYRYVKPCSAQDCTGLITSGPADEEELEDYEELYPFLPQIPDGSKFRSKKED